MTLLSTNHNEAAAECMAMIGRHIPSAEEKIRASESFQKDVLVAAHMEALHDAYILEMGSHEHSMHKLKVEVSSPTSSVHAISSLKPSTLKQLKVGKVHRRRVVRGTLCVNTLCTKVGPSGAGHTPIAVNVLEDEEGNATPIYIVCNSMMMPKVDVCSLDSAQAQLMFPIGSKVAIREPYVTRSPHGEVVLSVENSTDVVFLWVPDHQSRSDDDLNMGSKTDEEEELNDHGALNVINNVILDVADDDEETLESVIDNIGVCDINNVDIEDHGEKTLEVEELVHDSPRVAIDNIGICDTKNVDIKDHEETLKDKYLGHGSLDVSDDRRKCDMKDVDIEVPEGKSKVEHGPLGVVKNVGCGILKEVGVDEQETQEINIQENLGHIDEANVVNNAPKYEANACPEVDDTNYGSKCKEDENNVVDNNVNKVEEIDDGLKESEDVMMPSVGIEEKDENENGNDRIGSGNRSVELHSVEMVDVIGKGDGDSRVYDPTVVNGVQNRDEDVMHYTTASEEERILVEKEEETSDADASILRTKGNELFTRGEYIKAGEMYTRALKAAAAVTAHILLSSGSDVLDTDNERLKMEEVLCFSNRAEVWLRLGDDEKAFADADAAMAAIHLLQQHTNVAMAKALFRKGRALMGLRRYHEALVLFYHLQHLSKDPHLFNAITTCKSRLAHQGMKSRRAKPSQL